MHLIKLILAAACLGQALSSGIRQPAGTEDKTPSRADQERSAHRLQKRVEPVNHKTMQFLVDMAFSLMDKGIPTFCEALCFAVSGVNAPPWQLIGDELTTKVHIEQDLLPAPCVPLNRQTRHDGV